MARVLLLLAILCCARTAWADCDTAKTATDKSTCIALEKAQPAPVAGLLFDQKTSTLLVDEHKRFGPLTLERDALLGEKTDLQMSVAQRTQEADAWHRSADQSRTQAESLRRALSGEQAKTDAQAKTIADQNSKLASLLRSPVVVVGLTVTTVVLLGVVAHDKVGIP